LSDIYQNYFTADYIQEGRKENCNDDRMEEKQRIRKEYEIKDRKY
jgi:hypothetical protein